MLSKKRIILGIVSTILLVSACVAFVFPTANKLAAQKESEKEIYDYANAITQMTKEEKDAQILAAQRYNKEINNGKRYKTENELFFGYYGIWYAENSMLGYVEIPKINVDLPIHLGIDEETLYQYAGHMPNTSFPVPGKTTHCVISAHTAYPGKKFFDDLPEMEIGDEFQVIVLDQKYTYRVIKKVTVDPDDMSPLTPVEGKELVSLVTCFPYAVNTHRLVVTGEKIGQETVNIDASKNSSVELLDKKVNYFTEYLPLSLSITFSLVLILICIVSMIISQKKLSKKLSHKKNSHKVE